jgi:hypothetical protein
MDPACGAVGRKTKMKNRTKILLAFTLIVTTCLLLGVYFSGLSCKEKPGGGACVRILFVGNSYTFVNDLPGMFADLARAGGKTVEVGMAAEGGWTLADHAGSSASLDKIKSAGWDFVVLQEQSQIPSIAQFRTGSMYPAARQLAGLAKQAGSAPLFFLTWAHRAGWPENGLADYESMQNQIGYGYLAIARELQAPVVPVGSAWLVVRRQYPALDLWQADGSHPTRTGTYLAACVFYAAVFRLSPVGLAYPADLSAETARQLQTAAAEIVLKDPGQWNLP